MKQANVGSYSLCTTCNQIGPACTCPPRCELCGTLKNSDGTDACTCDADYNDYKKKNWCVMCGKEVSEKPIDGMCSPCLVALHVL